MSPDIPASVRARLLSQAKASGEEFERTLTRFAAERWLYRLGASGARSRCVLKGASLLSVWLSDPHRATRDVDVLATGDTHDAAMRELLSEVCAVPCPDDGVTFDLSALVIAPIRIEEEYAGVRSLFWAYLGTARIRMQVDIGIGDALTSNVNEIEYPSMLPHLPRASIRAYPRETSVAEKFEAMVKLGRRNSRMKDFHDVYALSYAFAFDGETLCAAIKGCFDRRATPWTEKRPDALTTAFYHDQLIQKLWQAYLRGGDILVTPPTRFDEVGEQIIRFLGPVRDSIVAGEIFTGTWTPEAAWVTKNSAEAVQA